MYKIYKLICSDGHWYIGSTKVLLNTRLIQHISMSKKKSEMKVYKHILSLGWENVTMELIKEVDSNILQEETAYIKLDDPLCLNTRLAHNTEEEKRKRNCELRNLWRQNNHEHYLEVCKKYRNKVREQETEEQKQKRRQYDREWKQNFRNKV
jgi:hypothetical protein